MRSWTLVFQVTGRICTIVTRCVSFDVARFDLAEGLFLTVAWGNAPAIHEHDVFWLKAIFMSSLLVVNMAFGQTTHYVPISWGVAPGYGEFRPLACSAA